MDKILKIVSLMGANGVGPSNGTNSEVNGSWLTEVLAWLSNAIVQIATVVWGWLISIFYLVVKFCLNLIDILQMFVEKIVGIDVYNQEGGLSAVDSLEDTDIIIRFITNEAILKAFRTILILGLLLLIIFSIIALVKQNYTAATTDGSDGVKNPREILKKAGKAIFLCLLVPFLLVFGILGSNAVLASVCNALKGDNDLTIGGLIFTASAYEANKFREYANDGLRVPITLSNATEVVRPADYATPKEMQVLFYKLASGKVYIGAINESNWWNNNKSKFTWVEALAEEDINVNSSQLVGNVYFSDFKEHFDDFYFEFFDRTPLAELGLFNDIIRSIYNTNWTRNKSLTNLVYNYSSTYKTQDIVNFGSNNGNPVNAQIIVNSDSYVGHEKFATIELEYFVMADLIDFAVEHNQTFYYVKSSDSNILWSDIDLDPEDDDNEIINISAYDATCKIFNIGTEDAPVYATSGESGQQIANSAFAVSYYNGVARLYWSEKGATSENTGATYIICVRQYKDDGTFNYIPVTQTTTKFRSAFLADDYDGPVVARGVFKSESLIPKDYCLPTAIVEQIVDDYGNELTNVEKTSPYAVTDSYVEYSTISGVMSEFSGRFSDFTGSIAGSLFENLFGELDDFGLRLKNDVMKDFEASVKAEASAGSELLINPNIAGFRYTSYDGSTPKTIQFYDKNGRKVTAGANALNPSQTEFNVTARETKTRYLVLQKSMIGDVIIPWYFADDNQTLDQVIANILDKELSFGDKYTFLIAEYTYDNIQFKVGEASFNMLLNFNIKSLQQCGRGTGDDKSGTSGEFIVSDYLNNYIGSDVHIEKKADLVVANGEIYYSNGTLFFGKKDAKELYNNFANDYLQSTLSKSIIDWIQESGAKDECKEVLGKIDSTYKYDSADIKGSANKGLSIFWATDFVAGASALISEYNSTYYAVEESPSVDSGGNPILNGTIKFYNQNNQPDGSEIEYSSKEVVTGYTVKQRIVVVSAANNGGAISYATVSDYDKSGYLVTIDDITWGDADKGKLTNRTYWYYDVTFTYSFTEYKKDGETVAVLGLKVDGVDIDFVDPTTGKEPSGAKDPGLLQARNNGVYCGALGKYILTANGTKNYMANNIQSTPSIKCSFSDGKGTSAAELKTINKKINHQSLALKSQSEFDNIYLYFMRGDLSWAMLFDFCLHLPTISWSPFKISFAFRCRVGTSYDYAEKVIYRLQNGQFYLDYNFRKSIGIGMDNIYRMSAINPFILLFSTVLVMSILWKTVWGLIRRVYDIVLLFLMLPAVCSTMPMDDGKRFGKWKDALLQQVFAAYSVLITLNIYFILVPMLKDVTTDLITATDLPTTITGMFATISGGIRGFGSIVSNIGCKFASLGGSVNNFVGNIGLSKFLIGAEVTPAEQALLGHVNSIVYIMFFLVLTTMLSNGKAIIENVLDIGKLEEGVDKEAIGNLKNVANQVKKPVALTGKAIGGLAKGTVKLGSKAFGAMMKTKGGSNAAERLTGTVEGDNKTGKEDNRPVQEIIDDKKTHIKPIPPKHEDPITEQNNTAQEPGALTGEYTDFGFVTDPLAGMADEKINSDIAEFNEGIQVETSAISALEDANAEDEKLLGAGGFEARIKEQEDKIKQARDTQLELDAEREQLQGKKGEANKFTGKAKEDWDARNAEAIAKAKQAEDEIARIKSEQAQYEADIKGRISARNDEIDRRDETIQEYRDQLETLYASKNARETNAEADSMMGVYAKEQGLSKEDFARVNDLFKEKEELERMKGAVNDTFDSEEEREKAKAEIDAEIERAKNEIINIKSKTDKSKHDGLTAYEEEAQIKAIESLGLGAKLNALGENSVSKERLSSMDKSELESKTKEVFEKNQAELRKMAAFEKDAEVKAEIEKEIKNNESLYKSVLDAQNTRDEFKKKSASTSSSSSTSSSTSTKPSDTKGAGITGGGDITKGDTSAPVIPIEEIKPEPEKKESDVKVKPTTTTQKVKVKTKPSSKQIAKNVAKGVGLAAASLVVPAPVTLAVVGGVLGVKGAKFAGKKINEGLGKHPQAQAFANRTKQALKQNAGTAAVAGVVATAVAGPVAGAVVAGATVAAGEARRRKVVQKSVHLKREVKDLKEQLKDSNKMTKEQEQKLQKQLQKKEQELKQYTERQVKKAERKKSGVGKGVAIGTVVAGPVGGVVGGIVAAKHNKNKQSTQSGSQSASSRTAQTTRTSSNLTSSQSSTRTSSNSNNSQSSTQTSSNSTTSQSSTNTKPVNVANAEFAKAVAGFSEDVKNAIVDMRKDIQDLKSKVGSNPELEKKLVAVQNDMRDVVNHYGASGKGGQAVKQGTENSKLSADAQKELNAKLAELNSKMNSIKSEINSGASGLVDEKIRKSESKLRSEIDSSHSQVMSKMRDEASKLDDKISRVKSETRDAMGMAIEARAEAKKSSQNKRTSAVHLVTQNAEGNGNVDEMRKNINSGLKTDGPPKK